MPAWPLGSSLWRLRCIPETPSDSAWMSSFLSSYPLPVGANSFSREENIIRSGWLMCGDYSREKRKKKTNRNEWTCSDRRSSRKAMTHMERLNLSWLMETLNISLGLMNFFLSVRFIVIRRRLWESITRHGNRDEGEIGCCLLVNVENNRSVWVSSNSCIRETV